VKGFCLLCEDGQACIVEIQNVVSLLIWIFKASPFPSKFLSELNIQVHHHASHKECLLNRAERQKREEKKQKWIGRP
jgi:hypothetical protein